MVPLWNLAPKDHPSQGVRDQINGSIFGASGLLEGAGDLVSWL